MTPSAHALRLAHAHDPERIVDESTGATKQSLADYYFTVAKPLLRHLAGRSVALLRCPDGIHGERFFQRREADCITVRDTSDLWELVQRGFVELHVRSARLARAERPDRVMFDLDPHPETPFATVAEAAMRLRRGLAAGGLVSFVKSTGARGLHVCVPIDPWWSWSDVRTFAERIATDLARAMPERFVTATARRTPEAVFVDHRCNTPASTTIAPYSARAIPGLPVAVPLAWEELASARPDRFTIATVATWAARTDPWPGFYEARQKLPSSRHVDVSSARSLQAEGRHGRTTM
jgi:bifunctional non-homologous end joining protein LigD